MKLTDFFTVLLLIVSVCISVMNMLVGQRNRGTIWAWVSAYWALTALKCFAELAG